MNEQAKEFHETQATVWAVVIKPWMTDTVSHQVNERENK